MVSFALLLNPSTTPVVGKYCDRIDFTVRLADRHSISQVEMMRPDSLLIILRVIADFAIYLWLCANLPRKLQRLFRRMANENITWGEERIANELLLYLGIALSPRTVRKYMPMRSIQ